MKRYLKNNRHGRDVVKYIEDIDSGVRETCKWEKLKIQRFKRMLKEEDYIIKQHEADFIIDTIETQLEFIDGTDDRGIYLRGVPFKMDPWQKFVLYSQYIFWYKNEPNNRVVKEAVYFLPRKNTKTTLIAAQLYALAIRYGEHGAPIAIVSSDLDQSKEVLNFISVNILNKYGGYNQLSTARRAGWIISDGGKAEKLYNRHYGKTKNDPGIIIDMEVYSNKSKDGIHSLKKQITYLDELHLFGGNASMVDTQLKNSTMNYNNERLCFVSTTAGMSMNGYAYEYISDMQDILVENDKRDDHIAIAYFSAEPNEDGEVDIYDKKQWYKANPALGYAIREDYFRNLINNIERKPYIANEFVAYNLNIFKNKHDSEFKPEFFHNSNDSFYIGGTTEEILEVLLEKNLKWYGGVDLSKRGDLSAVALFAKEEDTGEAFLITHGFLPSSMVDTARNIYEIDVDMCTQKNFMTICDGDLIDYDDVVNWFVKMRDMGFDMGEIGIDSAYSADFKMKMNLRDFEVYGQNQRSSALSNSFYHLENLAMDGDLFFCNNNLFGYCVDNLLVLRGDGTATLDYSKKQKYKKIDLFDAAVFSVARYLYHYQNDLEKKQEHKQMLDFFN